MKNILAILLGLRIIVGSLALYGESQENLPADISFLVADLKYSSERGVKICEIQHGILSAFNGLGFLYPGDRTIQEGFVDILTSYVPRGWALPLLTNDTNLAKVLVECPTCSCKTNYRFVLQDLEFQRLAKMPVRDRSDVTAYHAFLYGDIAQINHGREFHKDFPGILVIDQATLSCWVDKFKMTKLLDSDPSLAAIKPRWGSYTKTYSPDLAAKICKDLRCDTFVIKPRGAFLGHGVIIVKKDELDAILQYILTPSKKLSSDKDLAYSHWANDPFDTFLVEEFVTSDLISLPHLKNKIFQPTMRVVFVLVHTQGTYHVHFLGSYWKTPSLSLHEDGPFMDKHKDICVPPYYAAVEPAILERVQDQLRATMPILHQKMLESRP